MPIGYHKPQENPANDRYPKLLEKAKNEGYPNVAEMIWDKGSKKVIQELNADGRKQEVGCNRRTTDRRWLIIDGKLKKIQQW